MEGNQCPEWDKTYLVKERLRQKHQFDEPSRESKYGEFGGRPIIGRDSKINGGVYVGGGEREAVVVDDTKQPELQDVYRELLKRRKNQALHGIDFKDGILEEVFDLTREILPFDENKVDNITHNLSHDEKIALSVFINEKGGVCRHQALLAGYLLEKLKNDGLIRGTASIDRNFVPGEGGHAWVRYVNSASQIFIIDPAQDYIGSIEDAGIDRWQYERPRNSLSVLRDKVKKILDI